MRTKNLITRTVIALCALCFVQLTTFSALAQATLTTDKEDYAPYSVVYITGAGFAPGETVSNVVVQIAGPDPGAIYDSWTVVADGNGNFETEWLVFSDELIGTTLELTATGQTSLLSAQTTFTDANFFLYEDVGRSIERDAFARGSTAYAKIKTAINSRCYRVEWINPSSSVVATHDLPAPGGGGNADRNDSFGIPFAGPSGIWSVKVYEGPSTGVCTFTTVQSTNFFDVARAVIIGAGSNSGTADTLGGDNYVDQAAPTGVQGGGTGNDLFVKNRNSNRNQRTFVRFDFTGSGVAGTVTDAKLRLNLNSISSSRTYNAHRVTSTWAEGTVTWNLQPSVSGSASDTQLTGTIPKLMRWGVTNDVDGFVNSTFSNFGWRVSDSVENTATGSGEIGDFYSTEKNTSTDKTFGPVLLVDYNDLTLTCPGSVTVQCASQVPNPNPAAVTTSGGCGGAVVTHQGDVISGQTCPSKYTITRTYQATDACGNTSTCTQTITVNDNTAPVISATGTTLALGCNPNATTIDAALGTATATDNCGSVTPTGSDSAVTSSGCSRSQIRTWTATDACGNAASPVSRTVTWTEDTQAPVISATGTTLTLGCNPNATTIDAALGTATATDNCGSVTPTGSDSAVTSSGCSRSQIRTWTATDACGNAASPVSRTVTWTEDTQAPVISATGTTLTLGCNPNATTIDAALGTATATDNCGSVTPTGSDSAVTSSGCSRSQIRTWTATDACGNAASPVSRTVTWTEDTQAPVISATGTTLTLGCNPNATTIDAALGTATATDNCGSVTPTGSDSAVTSSGCSRSQIRTWTATDACGNAASPVSRTVTWTEDTQAPVISATGTTLTLGCNPNATTIDAALGTATATDNCGSVTPTGSDSAVTSSGCSRSQIRTWTATDACGNAASPVSRTVTWTEDTQAPVISATGTTLTLGCNPNATTIDAALGTATATDNCGSVTPTGSDSAVTSSGCSRSQIRTWTATDACGNAASPVSRTVTWTEDTQAPVISATGTTLTLGCNPNATTIDAALGTATATDNCGSVTPTGSDSAVTSSGCSRSQIRTWTATDACGNAASPVSRTVTWTEDTQAPVISATGTTLTLGCNPNATTIDAALGTATATDNCGSVTPTGSDSAVTSSGCSRSQIRTWTATDACGNAASPVSRTVTWTEDTQAPVISATGTTLTLGCNPNATTIDAALGTATATDNCGSVTPTGSDSAVTSSGCSRSQIRTWTATDACGNAASPVSRTVTWTEDTQAPVISATGTTLTLGCNPNATTIDAALGTATATDNCGSVTPTGSDSAVTSSGCSRSQIRTWTATDACGNAASPVSRTVTWTEDTQAPVISATGTTLTLGCNPNATTIDAALGTATATDNCGSVTPTGSDSAVTSSGCSRSQIRTWTATDACGNAASPVSRTVTWTEDTQAPVISATGTTLTLGCNPNATTIDAALGTATATDNCGSVTPTGSDSAVTSSGCSRSQIRTWTATDACGNSATSVSRTVTWTADTTPPVISATGTTLALGCNPNATAIAAALGSATYTDNCGPTTATALTGVDASVTSSGCSRSQTRTWNVSDACGNPATTVSRTATWTEDTTAPIVTITGPASASVYPLGTTVNFTGNFSDNCGAQSAQWKFDTNTKPVTVSGPSGTANTTYTFTTVGVYMVSLIVTDACGNSRTNSTVDGSPAMVVIYDPSAGFVTGGGWILSPIVAGMPYMSVSGKANFGFVSKYKAGANTPTGETEFQFQEGNLNFHSSTYNWLVVSGSMAQYKGTGTINGAGNYSFLLTAKDGNINNSGADGIRMKITDSTGSVVYYDNKLSSATDDTATPGNTQNLGGGSISIKTK